MKHSIKEISKRIPIKNRIEIGIQAYFVMKNGGSLIMPINEQGEEYKIINRINQASFREAEPIIDIVMKAINGWIEDGMPIKNKK